MMTNNDKAFYTLIIILTGLIIFFAILFIMNYESPKKDTTNNQQSSISTINNSDRVRITHYNIDNRFISVWDFPDGTICYVAETYTNVPVGISCK